MRYQHFQSALLIISLIISPLCLVAQQINIGTPSIDASVLPTNRTDNSYVLDSAEISAPIDFKYENITITLETADPNIKSYYLSLEKSFRSALVTLMQSAALMHAKGISSSTDISSLNELDRNLIEATKKLFDAISYDVYAYNVLLRTFPELQIEPRVFQTDFEERLYTDSEIDIKILWRDPRDPSVILLAYTIKLIERTPYTITNTLYCSDSNKLPSFIEFPFYIGLSGHLGYGFKSDFLFADVQLTFTPVRLFWGVLGLSGGIGPFGFSGGLQVFPMQYVKSHKWISFGINIGGQWPYLKLGMSDGLIGLVVSLSIHVGIYEIFNP